MNLFLTASALIVCVSSAAQAGVTLVQDYSEQRTATANAAGATRIRVSAKAGSLRIEGRSGLTEVRARGNARASSRDLLADIILKAQRNGSEVEVIVDMPDMRGDWGWDRHALLDLVVEVPNTIALEVMDSSGEAEIRGVASLDIEDSSGDLEIENIGGDVRIEDSSGGIRVTDVRGNVVVSDNSGEIDVRKVTGTFEVERDGSGSIDADEIGGDFIVGRDGSGGISYSSVKGKVEVPRRKRRGDRR